MKAADILAEIEQADDILIIDVIQAILRRYRVVFPEWELCFFALPKNDPECRRIYVEHITKMLHENATEREIAETEE